MVSMSLMEKGSLLNTINTIGLLVSEELKDETLYENYNVRFITAQRLYGD